MENHNEHNPFKKITLFRASLWDWRSALYAISITWMLIEGVSILYVVLAVVAMHVTGYFLIRR